MIGIYLYDCTKQAFDSNPVKYAKKNWIVKYCKPENSGYLSSKFLIDFYQNEQTANGKGIDAEVLACYEKTLDFWVKERINRFYNEAQIGQIAKELEALHNQPNFWYDFGSGLNNILKYLPVILLVGVGAYFINAIKK